jgi:hypothetical protein
MMPSDLYPKEPADKNHTEYPIFARAGCNTGNYGDR